jgi:ketosteroid isomerase-like protein
LTRRDRGKEPSRREILRSMSRETLDSARQVMEALGRRDLAALLAFADPEVEWHSFFAELGEGGVYRGHGGTRQYMSDLGDAWEVVRADVDDGIAVGEVAVLVGRIHYRGKGSGIETETPAGWMLRFRDGKVIRFRAFREPEEALAALGFPD